jgi:hypothetical protein
VLRELGFDLAQGYLFASALPAADMTQLIASSRRGGTDLAAPVLPRQHELLGERSPRRR